MLPQVIFHSKNPNVGGLISMAPNHRNNRKRSFELSVAHRDKIRAEWLTV